MAIWDNLGMNEFICTDGTRLPMEVRFSTKAKRWKLQLEFTGRLEVVIPAHEEHRLKDLIGSGDNCGDASDVNSNPITDFIEQHRHWIERAARRTKPQRETYQEGLASGLPTHLDFPLCDELWLVEYRPTQARSITARPDGLRRLDGTRQVFALKLSGAVTDEDLCQRALIRFVAKRAKEVIPPFAWGVCASIDASPNSITVNNRKTAWGVCTRSGDIRIDRKVIFLPKDLARQIVLHEAAHLKQLNHSQRFYDELLSYEGSTREAEKAVKKGNLFVPAWFHTR